MILHGNLSGLRPGELKKLEGLYRRRAPAGKIISAEAARRLTELSAGLNRQIGLLIDRRGKVCYVVIGDAKGLYMPDLKDHPLGRRPLRGLRLVHTHLRGESLTRDDLTDLALLRFDLLAALEVGDNGLPGMLHVATLKARPTAADPVDIMKPVPFHLFTADCEDMVVAVEDELNRQRAFAFKRSDDRERAVLVSVSKGPRHLQEDSLAELAELARSSDMDVADTIAQRPARIDPRHLLGSGKLKELVIGAMNVGATMIVFDQDLTPSQGSRIAAATELKVIDRSQLILDIFARRAHSREGKVQVELAQLKYRLPRLSGKGTAMSRLMGGIGGRGPGEAKLEVDRRRARDRIAMLEKQLRAVARSRRQRKSRRSTAGIPILSIVGYTNAGKSTLLNGLTASRTHTESRMFATLDTASRRLRFPKERDVIITDTVGFIRDLPRDLFNAFRATLEEMEDADLLLHLVDISSPRFEQHIESVSAILDEIGLGAKPVLLAFNKADRLSRPQLLRLSRRFRAIAVSALDGATYPPLLAAIAERLWPDSPH